MGRAVVGGVGISLMVGRMALRFWAARVLGRFDTRTLRIAGEQPVIDHGPYKVLRHPGLQRRSGHVGRRRARNLNWVAAAAVIVGMCGAYSYRVRCEEGMLRTPWAAV